MENWPIGRRKALDETISKINIVCRWLVPSWLRRNRALKVCLHRVALTRTTISVLRNQSFLGQGQARDSRPPVFRVRYPPHEKWLGTNEPRTRHRHCPYPLVMEVGVSDLKNEFGLSFLLATCLPLLGCLGSEFEQFLSSSIFLVVTVFGIIYHRETTQSLLRVEKEEDR